MVIFNSKLLVNQMVCVYKYYMHLRQVTKAWNRFQAHEVPSLRLEAVQKDRVGVQQSALCKNICFLKCKGIIMDGIYRSIFCHISSMAIGLPGKCSAHGRFSMSKS